MWTEEAFKRWWFRMGETFGKPWYETHGPEIGEAWRASLSEMSLERAAKVLEHYRISGDAFPPNLSQVVALARSLRIETQQRAISAPISTGATPESTAKAFDLLARGKGNMRRNVFLPGEGFGDFYEAKMAALKAGKTVAQFEAPRLARRGWTADLERQWQQHAHRLGGIDIEPPGLIAALEELEASHSAEASTEREAIQTEGA